MSTTPRGIYYPDPSGVPRRADFEDLATTSDAAINSAADRAGALASGTATVSLSGVNQNSVAITFPAGRFTSAPRVVATISNGVTGSGKLQAMVTGKSKDGATLFARTGDGTAATATNVAIDWIAHQP